MEAEEATHLCEQAENAEAEQEPSANIDIADAQALDIVLADGTECERNQFNAEDLAKNDSYNAMESNELRATEVNLINVTEPNELDSANDEKHEGDNVTRNADADANILKSMDPGAPDLIKQHSSAAMLNSEASAMSSVATAA